MTKEDIEEVVKRYPFVIKAIKNGEACAVFYVGNRKKSIEITDEVKEVYEILDEIYERETDFDVLRMIDGIRGGRSDVAILQDVHWQKNAYYERKSRFWGKIFECCIYRRLVTYEEIMEILNDF